MFTHIHSPRCDGAISRCGKSRCGRSRCGKQAVNGEFSAACRSAWRSDGAIREKKPLRVLRASYSSRGVLLTRSSASAISRCNKGACQRILRPAPLKQLRWGGRTLEGRTALKLYYTPETVCGAYYVQDKINVNTFVQVLYKYFQIFQFGVCSRP